MKRLLFGSLATAGAAVPLAFALMFIAAPATTSVVHATDCTYKAQWDDATKSFHCHDDGTNCVAPCPAPT